MSDTTILAPDLGATTECNSTSPRQPITLLGIETDLPCPSILWREVVGWPEYEVSSLGHVRRVKPGNGTREGKLCKPLLNRSTGYYGVALCRNCVQKRVDIHRLVAIAFLGPQPSPLHIVAHNDGVRTNNSVSNLRWATQSENLADMRRHGTAMVGSANPMSKLDAIDLTAIHFMKSLGLPCRVISSGLGVHVRTIYRVLTTRMQGASQ